MSRILFILLLFIGNVNFISAKVAQSVTYNNMEVNKTDAAGKKTGYWVSFGKSKPSSGFADDAVMEEGEYEAGKKTGLWKTYFTNGKLQYISILMAKAFNIENAEKLDGNTSSYIVRSTKNELVPSLENIRIGTREEVGSENGSKSRQSENFKEKQKENTSIAYKLRTCENKIVKELPKNQVYVGVTGIVGNSSALIGPQLTLKTKKDNLYGANLLIDGNGNKYFGVSVGWKIKLKK